MADVCPLSSGRDLFVLLWDSGDTGHGPGAGVGVALGHGPALALLPPPLVVLLSCSWVSAVTELGVDKNGSPQSQGETGDRSLLLFRK